MKSPKIPGALTGCAGEHFVAFRLSAMGCHVALTRGGVPNVDILVGSADGHKSVTIQVKTINKAFWPATKKKKEPACWYWPIGAKARELRGRTFFYAFVDLKESAGRPQTQMPMPDVFIVPADVVAESMSEAFPKNAKDGRTTWCSVYGEPAKQKMFFFHIEAGENRKEREEKWREAWHLIERALHISK